MMMHAAAMAKQGLDQQKWDESPCLPFVHELESLHCPAQLLSPGLQLFVHSLSLIHTVCNLLQISLGYLRMNHTWCHMTGLAHVAMAYSKQHAQWSRQASFLLHSKQAEMIRLTEANRN